MAKSSRQRPYEKQRNHSSNDAALDYSDSGEEINIVDEEEVSQAKAKKSRSGKEESSARVSRDSYAGEKRKLQDRGNGREDLAEAEHIVSKKTKDGERKDVKKKVRREMEDTERALKDEVRNTKLKKELDKQIKRSGGGSVEKGKYQDYAGDHNDSRQLSRGEHANERRYKDGVSYEYKYGEDAERSYKDKRGEASERSYKDKHGEASERSFRDKFEEDGDRSYKEKHGEVSERSYKDMYGEDGHRKYQEKRGESSEIGYEDKYEEEGGRSYKEKHGEATERSYKEKRGEASEKIYKDKYEEDGGRGYKEKHGEATERSYKEMRGEASERSYKVKYGEDGDRSYKEKHGEATERGYKGKYEEDADRKYKEKRGEDVERSYKEKHGEATERGYKGKYEEDADRKYREKYGEDVDRSYKAKHEEDGDRSYKEKHGGATERGYKGTYEEDADIKYKEKCGEDVERSYKAKYGDDGDISYKEKHGETTERGFKGKYEEDADRKYKEKYGEDVERSFKAKYGEDGDRSYKAKYGEDRDRICKVAHLDRSYKIKCREDGNRSYKVQYGEDADRRYEVKHGEDVDRIYKVKHGEDADRSYKDEYGEDVDRSYKIKCGENGDRSYKVYREDGDRSCKVKHGEDADRNYKDKYAEDADRDRRHMDSKCREDVEWKKRHCEDRHKDEDALRDHHGDKLATKHAMDESNAGGSQNKKLKFDIINYDGGQNNRYSDDRANKAGDKEDQNYSRSRSTMDYFDAEKKITTSGMVESVADKEGPHLCCVDADFNLSHNRQRSSPSSNSHLVKDQYRHSTEADLKSADSEPQERVRQNLLPFKEAADVSGVLQQPSLSKPTERLIDKDDSHLGDLSGKGCLTSDACASSMHVVDDSTLTRPGTGGSLDSKEFGKRSGVIEDRESFDFEGKGILQLPSGTPPTFQLSLEDTDDFSSAPSVKVDQLPSNSRSSFPPPRHRYKRINSSNVGRGYGNSRNSVPGNVRNGDPGNSRNGAPGNARNCAPGNFRNGTPGSSRNSAPCNSRNSVPNKPSPVMNSFTHFHYGPPPVGFHPVMHQFSPLPMFGVRPVMDIHSIYSHHDHSFGWQNPINDSRLPPLHGWYANYSVVNPDFLAYGRVDWNDNRELIGAQQLEKSADGGVNPEFNAIPQEEDPAVLAREDEIWLGTSSLQIQNGENQCDVLGDALAKEPSEPFNSIAEKSPNLSEIPRDDDDRLLLVYLSKLDISAELTHPELYNQCLELMDVEQNETVGEGSLELLYLEEVVKTQVELSKLDSGASLFVAINDCVFQRAMSLYKKQREDNMAMPLPSLPNRLMTSFSSGKNVNSVPNCDREDQAVPVPVPSPNEAKPGQLLPACSPPYEKVDEVVPDVNLEKFSEPSPSQVVHQVKKDTGMDDIHPAIEHASQSAPGSPSHLSRANDSIGGEHSAGGAQEQKLAVAVFDHIPFSKVSNEGEMSHSMESLSANVSRIHGALEVTH